MMVRAESTGVTGAITGAVVVLSIVGIVGGAIAKANPRVASRLLFVSGVGRFLAEGKPP